MLNPIDPTNSMRATNRISAEAVVLVAGLMFMLGLFSATGCAVSTSERDTFSQVEGPAERSADPASAKVAAMPSFQTLRDKIESGGPVQVVFLGGSLTWGANASEPQTTSYRGQIARRLLERYPQTQFRFHDAAIGGTGSDLGTFRLDRDVLAKQPDLVLLDFTANDNIRNAHPQRLSSYEWLVRRIITEGRAPVLSVIFPFRGDAEQGDTTNMPGRDATLTIAEAYHLPVADVVTHVQHRLAAGEFTAAELWPWDGAHPNDRGYTVFADEAWDALTRALENGTAMRVPDEPLHGHGYRFVHRVELADYQDQLPAGWRVDTPSRVAAWYDGLMSRWFDRVVVAGGKDAQAPPAPLKFTFRGQFVGVFGEETIDSGQYRVLIDGRPVKASKGQSTFDASSERMGGNRQHFNSFAAGLDESVDHTLEIVPVFSGDKPQELRFESICIAGSAKPRFNIQSP